MQDHIREKLHSELYPRETKLCYQPPQDSDSLKILSAAIIRESAHPHISLIISFFYLHVTSRCLACIKQN